MKAVVIECATTHEQFEEAYRLIDALHISANKLYVSKQGLKNLLYDHTQFCGLTENYEGFCHIKVCPSGDKTTENKYSLYRNIDKMPSNYLSPYEDENGETTSHEMQSDVQSVSEPVQQSG